MDRQTDLEHLVFKPQEASTVHHMNDGALITLTDVIRTRWSEFDGPFSNKLDEALALELDQRHGVYIEEIYGTIGKVADSLELRPHDEIFFPSFPFIPNIEQVINLGCRALLLNSQNYTWNLRADEITEKISDRTKAVIGVGVIGLENEINTLIETASKHDITIILDDTKKDPFDTRFKPTGSFDNLRILNFYKGDVNLQEDCSLFLSDVRLLKKARGCCGTTLFHLSSNSYLKRTD